MKFISDIFRGEDARVTIEVSPRKTKDRRTGEYTEGSGELITHYTSKKGYQSLIFNPTVYMRISDHGSVKTNGTNLVVPANMVYRLMDTLGRSYEDLVSAEMYRQTQTGEQVIDNRAAAAAARKMSFFTGTLVITPTLIRRDHDVYRGIMMSLSNVYVTQMIHSELIGFINVMDHFDLSTYTLLGAMVDELESMNWKLDQVLDILQPRGSPPMRIGEQTAQWAPQQPEYGGPGVVQRMEPDNGLFGR